MKVIVDRGFAPRLIGRDPRDVEAIWSEFRETTYWTGNGGIVTFAHQRHRHGAVGPRRAPRRACRFTACSAASAATACAPPPRSSSTPPTCRASAGSSPSFAPAATSVLKGGWGHDLSIAFGRDAEARPRHRPDDPRGGRRRRRDHRRRRRRIELDGEPRHHHGARLRALPALLARGRAARGRHRRLEAAPRRAPRRRSAPARRAGRCRISARLIDSRRARHRDDRSRPRRRRHRHQEGHRPRRRRRDRRGTPIPGRARSTPPRRCTSAPLRRTCCSSN